MARDERLKKVQDAGADFIETARTKAEEFLQELSRAGGDTQGRAQGAIDDLIESGRKGTEGLAAAIRREIQNQLAGLGLATRADLAALERRLIGREAATAAGPAAPKKAAAKKVAPKKAGAKKAAPKKTAAKKAAATAAPATPGPAATAATSSGAKKSATRQAGAGKAGAAKKTTKKTAV